MNESLHNVDNKPKHKNRFVSFGAFTFDLETEELFKQGESVKMQPLPAKLLAILLRQKGELVRKEDIKMQLWPSSIVDYEQRIASIMRDIRGILGDNSQHPQFVETVAKKGYRFIAAMSYADNKNGNIQIQIRIRKPYLYLSSLLVLLFLLGWWLTQVV